MSEKGYYGWIHGLKNAAIQSQVNGQRLLQEEKAGRMSPEKREAFLKQLKSSIPQRPSKGTETAEDPITIEDESGKVVETVPFSTARKAIVSGMRDLAQENVPGFEFAPSEGSIQAAGGEPAVFSEIELGKRIHDLKLYGDANRDGKTDANDAAQQAHNWESDKMPKESLKGPPGMEGGATQPRFPLAAQARIEAGVKFPGDVLPEKAIPAPGETEHEAPWYNPDEARAVVSKLNKLPIQKRAGYDPSEEKHDEDEDTRFLGIDMSGQLGANVRESVAHKIRRMLNG